jgi:membrane-associated protein
MEFIHEVINFILNFEQPLRHLVNQSGSIPYIVLFLVIFAETGLVVIPFLPGDSMIFVVGAFCATGMLDLPTSLLVLSLAAVLGDTANYHIGKFMGPKVFSREDSRFFKKEYLIKTHKFYEKHGGKTIIIARFMPIIRTFAPFVAGIGSMSYTKFISFNVVGGILWVFAFVIAGFFFGNLPFVKNNLTMIVLTIVLISILPGIIAYLKSRLQKRTA